MAIAITLLGSSVSTTATTNLTVTATPAAGSTIIVVGFSTGFGSGGSLSNLNVIDNNAADGQYILQASDGLNVANYLGIWSRGASISSGVSTTFTYRPGIDGFVSDGEGFAVFQVTGASNPLVIRTAGNGAGTAGTTPTVTLLANLLTTTAALTGNAVFGGLINLTNPAGVSQRTSFTQQVNTGYITPTTGFEAMSIPSGETASAIAWGSTSASAWQAVAIEVAAAAGGSMPPVGLSLLPFLCR